MTLSYWPFLKCEYRYDQPREGHNKKQSEERDSNQPGYQSNNQLRKWKYVPLRHTAWTNQKIDIAVNYFVQRCAECLTGSLQQSTTSAHCICLLLSVSPSLGIPREVTFCVFSFLCFPFLCGSPWSSHQLKLLISYN